MKQKITTTLFTILPTESRDTSFSRYSANFKGVIDILLPKKSFETSFCVKHRDHKEAHNSLAGNYIERAIMTPNVLFPYN